MHKPGVIKKFLMLLSFIAFLNAGYLSVSVMTAYQAKAQTAPLVVTPAVACNVPCIFPGTFVAAITGTGVSIVAAIGIATAQITAQFTPAITDFSTTIYDKIDKVTNNIKDWIDTFWNHNLRPAMQEQSDQSTAMDAGQSNAIALFADAARLVRAVKEMEAQKIDSHRQQRVGEDVCAA